MEVTSMARGVALLQFTRRHQFVIESWEKVIFVFSTFAPVHIDCGNIVVVLFPSGEVT